MATRGEPGSNSNDPTVLVLAGCGGLVLLLLVLLGAGAVMVLRSAPVPVSAPVSASAPVSVPVSAPVPPPAPSSPPDLGHGGGGFYDPQAMPSTDPSSVTLHEGAEVTGALSPEVIRRVVRRHVPEVQHCYEVALRGDPGLSARVVAHIVIGPTGAVTSATADGSTDTALTTCIAATASRWTFPAPDGGGTVTVSYPFVLSPG